MLESHYPVMSEPPKTGLSLPEALCKRLQPCHTGLGGLDVISQLLVPGSPHLGERPLVLALFLQPQLLMPLPLSDPRDHGQLLIARYHLLELRVLSLPVERLLEAGFLQLGQFSERDVLRFEGLDLLLGWESNVRFLDQDQHLLLEVAQAFLQLLMVMPQLSGLRVVLYLLLFQHVPQLSLIGRLCIKLVLEQGDSSLELEESIKVLLGPFLELLDTLEELRALRLKLFELGHVDHVAWHRHSDLLHDTFRTAR